jgi:hypothetical protein
VLQLSPQGTPSRVNKDKLGCTRSKKSARKDGVDLTACPSARRCHLEWLCRKAPFLKLIEAFPDGTALSLDLPRKAIVVESLTAGDDLPAPAVNA